MKIKQNIRKNLHIFQANPDLKLAIVEKFKCKNNSPLPRCDIGTRTITVFFIIFIWSFILSNNVIFAQSPSPKIPTVSKTSEKTATASSDSDKNLIEKLKQIEELKEKIATRVAEIRDREKGAMLGIVKQIQNNTITLTTKKGDKTFNYQEDTLFFNLKNNTKTEINSNKLKEGDNISVFGYYNETKDDFSAKFIYLQDQPMRIAGKVADIDKQNFTVTLKDREGQKIIDIEKFTNTSSLIKGKGLQRYGFSKIKIGDMGFAYTTKNPKDENRFTATRLIIIPIELPTTPTPTATIKPSPTAKSPTATTAKPSPTKIISPTTKITP